MSNNKKPFNKLSISKSIPDITILQFNPNYYQPFTNQLGYALFKQVPIIHNKKVNYLNKTLIRKLSQPNLEISDFYLYWRWEYLFKCIKKMEHLQLQINEAYYKYVLRDINYVSWIKLKKLKLNLGNVTNLQGLQWLDCINLQQIDLNVRVNRINKSLMKGLFPKLRYIKIQCEQIIDIDFGRVQLVDEKGIGLFVYSRNGFIRNKLSFNMIDLSFLSKVGCRGHLGELNCGKNESKKMQNNEVKSEIIQYKSLKIVELMLTQIIKDNLIEQQQNNVKKYKSGRDYVIQCLFDRKFEIINVNQNQNIDQIVNNNI